MLIPWFVVLYIYMSEEIQTPSKETPKEFDPSEGNPFFGRNFQTNEPGSISSAAEIVRRRFSPLDIASAVFLGGMLTAGIASIAASEGGNSNGAERGTVDNTIESITLNTGANIRFDPYVGDNSTNTEALHLDAEVVINVKHDVRVLEGTNNGTWYGISVNEVEPSIPSIASENDKDGIVWVNEKGVKAIKRTDLTTK